MCRYLLPHHKMCTTGEKVLLMRAVALVKGGRDFKLDTDPEIPPQGMMPVRWADLPPQPSSPDDGSIVPPQRRGKRALVHLGGPHVVSPSTHAEHVSALVAEVTSRWHALTASQMCGAVEAMAVLNFPKSASV